MTMGKANINVRTGADSANVVEQAGRQVLRKVWLPKLLYLSLPYFYVAAGVLALIATVYISEWFWVLPHYLLFSVACLHFGLSVFNRRRRNKP